MKLIIFLLCRLFSAQEKERLAMRDFSEKKCSHSVHAWAISPFIAFVVAFGGRYLSQDLPFDVSTYVSLNIYYITAVVIIRSIYQDLESSVLVEAALRWEAQTSADQHKRFTALISHVFYNL